MSLSLTPESREDFVGRIQRIDDDTPARWGKMQPVEMLAHLRRCFEVSLGEVEVSGQPSFLFKYIVGPIAFSGLFSWPKGKLQAPAIFLPEVDGELSQEMEKLIEALDRFLRISAEQPARKSLHPLFGPKTLKFYRRIHGLHMRHHLSQFGV